MLMLKHCSLSIYSVYIILNALLEQKCSEGSINYSPIRSHNYSQKNLPTKYKNILLYVHRCNTFEEGGNSVIRKLINS